MRNMMTASGAPNDNGRFVTIMKTGPRFLRVCSLAASDAEVDDAGYSPKALVRVLDGSSKAG
jgi:hypothetical protein